MFYGDEKRMNKTYVFFNAQKTKKKSNIITHLHQEKSKSEKFSPKYQKFEIQMYS